MRNHFFFLIYLSVPLVSEDSRVFITIHIIFKIYFGYRLVIPHTLT